MRFGQKLFSVDLQEKKNLQGRSELASQLMGKNASSELISTYFEKGERRKKGDPKVVRKLMPTPTVVKLYCRQIEANERDKLAESFLDYNTQAHTLCCECSYKYLIRGGQKVQKFSGDNMSNIGNFVK